MPHQRAHRCEALKHPVDVLGCQLLHLFAVAHLDPHVDEVADVNADTVGADGERSGGHVQQSSDFIMDPLLGVFFGAPDGIDVALHELARVHGVAAA